MRSCGNWLRARAVEGDVASSGRRRIPGARPESIADAPREGTGCPLIEQHHLGLLWALTAITSAGSPGRAFIERDGGAIEMKRSGSGERKPRKKWRLALVGLFAGAALAYAFVAWRRALMPESQMTVWPDADEDVAVTETADEVSIYQVKGEDAVAADADDIADGDRGEPGRVRKNALADIEGIGPAYTTTLADLGLTTTADLLVAGANPKGREEVALKTGISPKLILRWVNQADLFRVKGVGEQYSDLLEAAGVDTVPELAQRRADNLTKKMAEVNEQKRLVRRVPTESQVAAWIEFAKGLPRVVTY